MASGQSPVSSVSSTTTSLSALSLVSSSTSSSCSTSPSSSAAAAASNSSRLNSTGAAWRHLIRSLYPNVLNAVYCVPPVFFNRVPYSRGAVAGQSVLMLQQSLKSFPPAQKKSSKVQQSKTKQTTASPTQYGLWPQESQQQAQASPLKPVLESDCRDDFAQLHVLINLQELGNDKKEVMFILSQLGFTDYLNQPSYAAAAKQLPRPADLGPKYARGEFDFLIITRHYGILIGELKSVGRFQTQLNMTAAQADADVAKRVEKAVSQLNRSGIVVEHLVSDIAPGLTVRKTLFLPYVTRAQLLRVLTANPQLEQVVCQTIGTTSGSDAVDLCLCSEQLSDPSTYWHVTPAVLSQLGTWWRNRMTCTVDTLFTDDLYLDIVARFVGPATTVRVHCPFPPRLEIRLLGEAVAELGFRLARLVLTPQQLDLLTRCPSKVWITGPPGTGKTVVLVLMGLKWLLQGNDVYIASIRQGNLAVSHLMLHQLLVTLAAQTTATGRVGTPHLLTYDLCNEADIVRALQDVHAIVTSGRPIRFLVDEAHFGVREWNSFMFQQVKDLLFTLPDLHIWVAGMQNSNIPQGLQLEALTAPLRSAPAVLREIQLGLDRLPGTVHRYTDITMASPCDGVKAIRLCHQGQDHSVLWPANCYQCGTEMAEVLRGLNVGTSAGNNTTPNSPLPLQYRDVFVLTRSRHIHDDVVDDTGQVTSPASGVVRGLRDAGIPVRVLGHSGSRSQPTWERDAADIALARTDTVTVAFYKSVMGLERKVVAWLPGKITKTDDEVDDDKIEALDRVYTVSRCTTQLIIIEMPKVSDLELD